MEILEEITKFKLIYREKSFNPPFTTKKSFQDTVEWLYIPKSIFFADEVHSFILQLY